MTWRKINNSSLRLTCCLLVLCYSWFCGSCSSPTQSVSTTSMLTSSPAALSSVSTSVVQSVSVAEYLLLRVPSCDDIEILEQPIKFDWPNIEKRIEELGDALWGYYHCNQPQKDLVAFYQAHMPEAPYNNQETNWIERAEGEVGIYYNPANAWVYIWIVPRPGVPEQSLVIVAQSYVLIHC